MTDNYRYPAYILQLDVQGYFMAMEILNGCSKKEQEGLDLELIDFLLCTILYRDPVEGSVRIGPLSDWKGLPASKSLLLSPPGVGLPIGDLTSQLFSRWTSLSNGCSR